MMSGKLMVGSAILFTEVNGCEIANKTGWWLSHRSTIFDETMKESASTRSSGS